MRLLALVVVLLLACASSARAGPWERPLAGPVVRAFAVSADRFARGQHRGVDLAAPPGTPVHAACGGRVRFAGSVPGGGRTVSVGCGRLVATYQHLGALAVRRGRLLAAAAVVGTAGRSGLPRDRPAHLHLGAREAASGRYVDPLGLFGTRPRTLPPAGVAPPRRLPLGRAPRPAPAPLDPVRVVAPAPGRGFEPREAPAVRVPLLVWFGLAAFGFGLPLGSSVRRHRRRRSADAAGARARRWAAAHR